MANHPAPVLITGASRNTGRAIALRFASEGANLILGAQSSREALDAVASECRSLGVKTLVHWAGCRPVAISVRVVVSRTEDLIQLRSRLMARLNTLIAPDGNWPFGRVLRASHVYEAIVAEPGAGISCPRRRSRSDTPRNSRA